MTEKLKLLIVPDSREQLVLYTDGFQVLPGQKNSTYESWPNELPIITVAFMVDGDNIKVMRYTDVEKVFPRIR